MNGKAAPSGYVPPVLAEPIKSGGDDDDGDDDEEEVAIGGVGKYSASV